MSLPDDYTITKALVFLSTQEVLREINNAVYEKVSSILKEKYNCYLYDCYDHPEYLNQILKEFYGDSFTAITDNIKSKVGRYSERTKVNEFIHVVCKS